MEKVNPWETDASNFLSLAFHCPLREGEKENSIMRKNDTYQMKTRKKGTNHTAVYWGLKTVVYNLNNTLADVLPVLSFYRSIG
jgi:hypothetical protein